ncbi:hypothetical protein L6164_016632 [Bauhinia variegata]|uniref:Uncharacterized protein n=1 Tax=Bauhinia variegata TaxID=167791 RepID=A0ACB9NP75_BAUVA|nr:hypothetical protein L6164_016632 [Bauhinia variegata]
MPAQGMEPSVEAFGNGIDGAVVGVAAPGRGKRRVMEELVDKATLQKQRRMIKNRESAARSRERTQLPSQRPNVGVCLINANDQVRHQILILSVSDVLNL